jgi:hypothetical protein
MKTVQRAVLWAAILAILIWPVVAETPKPADAKPLANYITVPAEKVYYSGDAYYVQYRDAIGRRAYLRLEQGVVNAKPKAAARYGLSITRVSKKEYAPVGSAVFEAALNPRRSLYTRFDWVLKGPEKTVSYKGKGEKLSLDDLAPGSYDLSVQAYGGSKVLASASTQFTIAGLPELEGVVKSKGFNHAFTTETVEVSAKLKPVPSGVKASYTFQRQNSDPVAASSITMPLEAGAPPVEVIITADLDNGAKLRTTVSVSAQTAPPESLVLSKGLFRYTTEGASVEITANLKNARPGTDMTTVRWGVDQDSPQENDKTLKLAGLDAGKTYVVSASSSSANGTVIRAKDMSLHVPVPYIGIRYEQGELVIGEDNLDIRNCRILLADLAVTDKDNVPQNVTFKWALDKQVQQWDTQEINTTLNAGSYNVEVHALNRATGKVLAMGSSPIRVAPGPIVMNPFVAELEGFLGGTDTGGRFFGESLFTGRSSGTLRGPVKTEMEGDAEAMFEIDLIRHGRKDAKDTILEGTLVIRFQNTTIQSSQKNAAAVITSAIRVPLAGGYDPKEAVEVAEGIVKGQIFASLAGDRLIHGKTVAANISPEFPIRLVLNSERKKIRIRFRAPSLVVLSAKSGNEGGAVPPNESVARAIAPKEETKPAEAGGGRAAPVPGQEPKPAASAPAAARPKTRRKFTVADDLGIRVNLISSLGSYDIPRLILYYTTPGYEIKYADIVYDRIIPLPSHVKRSGQVLELGDLAF